MATGRVFNVAQAAAYLGVHPETVRRAYRHKELIGYRDRLRTGGPLIFEQEALDAFRASRVA